MSENDAVLGIVLTHGEMGRGMVDAVRRIAGDKADGLEPLSNSGQSEEALQADLDQLIGDRPAVIFTDLLSGSCALTARKSCLPGCASAKRVVVSGVNLPMLLDFVFHRDLTLEELLPRLLEKGRQGVQGFFPDSRP